MACPHLEGAGVHISIFKRGSKRGPCRLLVRTLLWAVGTWAHALCGSWWSCGCCGRKAASPPGLSTEAGNLTFYVKHPNLEVLQKEKNNEKRPSQRTRNFRPLDYQLRELMPEGLGGRGKSACWSTRPCEWGSPLVS